MCMRWDSLRFLFGVNSQSVKVMHSCTIEPQRSIRIRRSCLRRTSRTFKSVIRKPIRTQNPLSSPSSLSQAVIDITARVFEFHYFPLFLVCVFFCFPFCFFHSFSFLPLRLLLIQNSSFFASLVRASNDILLHKNPRSPPGSSLETPGLAIKFLLEMIPSGL